MLPLITKVIIDPIEKEVIPSYEKEIYNLALGSLLFHTDPVYKTWFELLVVIDRQTIKLFYKDDDCKSFLIDSVTYIKHTGLHILY